MAKPKVRAKNKGRQPKQAHGADLKPIDYQPSKAELEADVRLPASLDRVMDALFAGDRRNASSNQTS